MPAEMAHKPKTVLMTTDTVGGVWTYSVQLAAALAEYGIETILAAMGGRPSDAQRAEVAQLPRTRIVESELRLEWMDDPWNDVARAGKWLRQLEAIYHPDVIHLNNFAHGDLGWNAPVLMVGHSCVLSWWRAVHGVEAPVEWDRYASRVAAGLRAADLVVAPTHAMAVELRKYYGPFRESKVIENASDPEVFKSGLKEPFVLAAGRLWDEAKNISALLRVAGKVDWSVCLAGEMRGEPDVGVTFLGRLSRAGVAKQMARASIYALPARYEPFGLSVLEAALSGCALVLGDIPSLRENWEGCALFVNPDSDDELQRALRVLIENDANRERMGEAARERGLRFSGREMAQKYASSYQRILAGRMVTTCV